MSSPSLTPEPPVLPIASGPIKGAAAAHGKTVYLDSAPYPEVSGTGGYDAQTIAMLKEDYAGSDSELTAVLQYVYDNIMITEDESFSNAMLQIAIVEMTHLDMLGDAIRALGGDASFSDGEHFWQASSVDYTTDIEKMLKQDIESETKAIQTYQRQAEQTRNPSVSRLLLRIAEDEKLHLRFFKETLAALQREKR